MTSGFFNNRIFYFIILVIFLITTSYIIVIIFDIYVNSCSWVQSEKKIGWFKTISNLKKIKVFNRLKLLLN